MTTNDEREVQCMTTLCYGVVKEYSEDGVRDPPDEVIEEYNTLYRKLKSYFNQLVGRETEPITWHECSVCHTYHPHLSE